MNDTPLAPTETEATAETSTWVDDFPEINTPEWDAMNRRRGELIRKRLYEGLTPEEQLEYARLQSKTSEALQRTFPPSPLVDERRLAELEARVFGKREEPTE